MILETKRLILRPWKENDAEDLYQYAKDPEVGPVAGWKPHESVEESREIIKNALSGPEAYAVCLKEDGKPIGAIELMLDGSSVNNLKNDDECELGYWIAKPFWGRGLIPEAGKEMLRRAFEDLKMKKVWCGYYDGNEKSKRVQEKLGFKYQFSRDVDVPLMNEKRIEHMSCITNKEWKMNYKIIDKNTYYRKDVYRRFTEDCKCSSSITARIDVTEFAAYAKQTNTKFYINFLFILTKVLNSRDDYKMDYLFSTDELVCYDVINPTHYVFRKETETCTPVYSEYCSDYKIFYRNVLNDIEMAKTSNEPAAFDESHPNWFDASYLPWVSYDSLHMELPDGYLYFPPIVHWGKYREENGRLMMPVTVRLNHAIADGYLIAKVFELLENEMKQFIIK